MEDIPRDVGWLISLGCRVDDIPRDVGCFLIIIPMKVGMNSQISIHLCVWD